MITEEKATLGDHIQQMMNTVEMLDAINESSKETLDEDHFQIYRREIAKLRQLALDLKADIIRLIPLCYHR